MRRRRIRFQGRDASVASRCRSPGRTQLDIIAQLSDRAVTDKVRLDRELDGGSRISHTLAFWFRLCLGMYMSESAWEWSAEVRFALGSLQGRRVSVPTSRITSVDELAIGYAVGLVARDDLVDFAARARDWGDHCTSDLGELTPGQVSAILIELLRAGSIENFRVAADWWFAVIVRLLVASWRRSTVDPRLEFQELVGVWGGGSASAASRVEPRGLDALVFGRRAQKRYVERVARRFCVDR